MKLAISVSFCADHRKGDGQVMDAWEHGKMLIDTLQSLHNEYPEAYLIVCANAVSGELSYWHYFWDCFKIACIETAFRNHGYLEGATWAIGRAIEISQRFRHDLLVHLCEDVIPRRGIIREMAERMEREQLLYIGERWRDESVNELSTQFFGCRVDWFAERFKGTGENGLLAESYMGHLLKGQKIALIGREYEHTHTFSEYQRLLAEARK